MSMGRGSAEQGDRWEEFGAVGSGSEVVVGIGRARGVTGAISRLIVGDEEASWASNYASLQKPDFPAGVRGNVGTGAAGPGAKRRGVESSCAVLRGDGRGQIRRSGGVDGGGGATGA